MVAATIAAGLDVSAENAVDRAEALIAEVEKRYKATHLLAAKKEPK
jgi:hypothetical protein